MDDEDNEDDEDDEDDDDDEDDGDNHPVRLLLPTTQRLLVREAPAQEKHCSNGLCAGASLTDENSKLQRSDLY